MGLKQTESLNDMTREYAPHTIVRNEFAEQNYIYSKLKKDFGWKDGAEYQIPWEFAAGFDVEIGGLIDEDDIGQGIYKKATETTHGTLFGALKYHERDLKKFSTLRQSFLKMMPVRLKNFTKRMNHVFNIMILSGGEYAKLSADGAADGKLTIGKPKRFQLGDRFVLKSDSQPDLEIFIGRVDVAGRAVYASSTRATHTPIDVSLYTTADNASIMIPGYNTGDTVYTLIDHILPASLGGKDTIHGVNKNSSPLLVSHIEDGTSWNITNVSDKLYDWYFDIKEHADVATGEILCGYNFFKEIAKKYDAKKEYQKSDVEVGIGMNSVKILGPLGTMTLTAIKDMPNDKLFMIDWDAFVLAGDELFKTKVDLDGNTYHRVRKKTGYEYITDIGFSGNLICTRADTSGCVHSLTNFA